jgi:hypothetical protein
MNWTNAPQTISFSLARRSKVTDFWNDNGLGTHERSFVLKDVPARSGHILVCEPTWI